MYFETGDRICADFRRSGNADHAPVIEYSMGDCDHYCVAFNRILSVLKMKSRCPAGHLFFLASKA